MEPVEVRFIMTGDLAKDINRVKQSIHGLDDTTKGAAGKANQNLGTIGKGGSKIGKTFSSGFSSYLNPATLGLSALSGIMIKLGKDAYQFSKNVDKSLLEVKTISQSTKEDFEGMRDSVLSISKLPIKDDAVELNKALYQIVSAGYDGADGLRVLEASAKAATGGVTSTITAADGLTTVMNAWGASINDVDSISDKMFTTVRLGKTTMGELSSNIAKVAPLASSLGVSFDEVFAATASITKQGTPTSEAFTQMRAALTAMNGVLGDGWAKTMTFQEGLAQVREMSGGSNEELKKLLGTDEAVLATLALTGDKAAGAAEDLQAMSESTGAATEAYKTMAESVDAKWQQVHNKWNAQLDKLGVGLQNMSGGLADLLNKVLGGDADAGDSFQKQSTQVSVLVNKLKDSNLTLEEQKNLIEEISKIDQSVVEGVFDNEVLSVQKLDENLNNYNLTQAKQAELARVNAEILEKQGKINEIEGKKRTNSIIQEKALYEQLFKIQDESYLKGDANKGNRDLLTSIVNDTDLSVPERWEKFREELYRIQDELGVEKERYDLSTGRLGNYDESGMKEITRRDEKDLIDLQKEIEKLQKEASSVEMTLPAKAVIEKVENEDSEVAIPVNITIPPKTIKDLEKELKELEAKQGSFGDPFQEAANIDKIKQKQKQIDAQWLKVREAMHGTSKELVKMEGEKLVKVEAQTEGFDMQLVPVLDLSKEEAERLETMKKQAIEMASQEEKMEQMLDFSLLLGEAFSIAADEAMAFDEDLAEILGSLGEVTFMAGDLVKVINDPGQNSLQKATSLIGILSQINNELSKTRDNIWEKIFGSENESRIEAFGKEITKVFGSALWELPDIWKDSWKALFGDKDEFELPADFDFAEYLGFDASSLAQSIYDGVTQGLETSKEGIGDWADTFGSYLQKMFEQEFMRKLQSQYLEAIMLDFTKAYADGSISDKELADLENKFIEMAEGGEAMWNAFKPILDKYETIVDETSSASTGAIKTITQEQAGMLDGRLHSIQFKIIELGDIQARQLAALNEIERNTRYNVHLEDIDENIEQLHVQQLRTNSILSAIAEKDGGFQL